MSILGALFAIAISVICIWLIFKTTTCFVRLLLLFAAIWCIGFLIRMIILLI